MTRLLAPGTLPALIRRFLGVLDPPLVTEALKILADFLLVPFSALLSPGRASFPSIISEIAPTPALTASFLAVVANSQVTGLEKMALAPFDTSGTKYLKARDKTVPIPRPL